MPDQQRRAKCPFSNLLQYLVLIHPAAAGLCSSHKPKTLFKLSWRQGAELQCWQTKIDYFSKSLPIFSPHRAHSSSGAKQRRGSRNRERSVGFNKLQRSLDGNKPHTSKTQWPTELPTVAERDSRNKIARRGRTKNGDGGERRGDRPRRRCRRTAAAAAAAAREHSGSSSFLLSFFFC